MADTLLATCYMEFGYDDFRPLLEIYRSDTGRIYGIDMDSSADGKKIYGSPKVVVKEIKTEQQEYTSPSMMYTGMSSGGVGVGQATYYPGTVKTKLKASGKGYISISIGEHTCGPELVKPSPEMIQAFKRDPVFNTAYTDSKRYNESGIYLCTPISPYHPYADQNFYSIGQLDKLAELLNRMLNYQLPKTEEEVYDEALLLARSSSPDALALAVKYFESIPDYKDAKDRALQAKTRQAVLLQENKGKRKTITIIAIVALCILAAYMMISAHSKAVKNLPNVEQYLCWHYYGSDEAYGGNKAEIKFDKSSRTLTYSCWSYGYKATTNYIENERKYNYRIEVSWISTYVIRFGNHTFKINDSLTTIYDKTYYKQLTEGKMTLSAHISI